ncbi:hypothetical protein ABS858_01275 [Vibrio neptunius]|uniref:hypothetical protein n=1 Tax=Vibrio neptunius TaxID=170651 RepID=UPI003314FCE5
MRQHYFGNWYNDYTSGNLTALKSALKTGDTKTVAALSEELFDSYLDVTAALDIKEIKQYAEVMGDVLTDIKLDVCMGELVDHHQPDYIEMACRNSIALGIGFPFYDYYSTEMTANRMEFDVEFFESTVEPGFKQLYQAGKMSITVFFKLVCDIVGYLDPIPYTADYLFRLLQSPEIDISTFSEEEFAECLDVCFGFYHLNPEIFRLFVKQAKGRKATKSTEVWQESREYYLITYQFTSSFGERCAWHDYEESYIDAFTELKHSGIVSDVEAEVVDCLRADRLDKLAEIFINA